MNQKRRGVRQSFLETNAIEGMRTLFLIILRLLPFTLQFSRMETGLRNHQERLSDWVSRNLNERNWRRAQLSTARAPHLKSSHETSDSNSRGFDPYTISSRAGWRPNPRRSSRPVLTVPLLLRTSHQEEPEGASYEKRERDLWGVGTPEVFFCTYLLLRKANGT